MNPAEPTLEELAAEPAASVVRTYLERWDAYDVEGMLALLGDGIVFWFWEDGPHAYRERLPYASAWVMAAGFEVRSYELQVEDERMVHATVDWSTRLHLLGLRHSQ